MNQNVFLVAIEGCDGVGKTSLLNYLSNYYEGCNDICFVKDATNLMLDKCICQYRKSESYDSQIHMYLETLSTYITLFDTIENMKDFPKYLLRIIILDRYWYSLLVYTRVLLSQDVDQSVMRILPQPNWVIYLRCDPAQIYTRKHQFEPIEYGQKKDNCFSNFCEFQSEIDCEYHRVLNMTNQKYTELRTDIYSTEQVALDVIEKIKVIRRGNLQQ